MPKTVFITGASSGIGRATTLFLLNKGFRVVVCGRRKERLNEITSKFPDSSYALPFDVREKSEVKNSIASLPDEWSSIDILVNNAGNAHGLASIQDGSLEDWEAMIDINVKGLLYVSHFIIPKMIAGKSGHIINIGSIAGKEVYPKGNVYCASKHAVDAINSGMRLDLIEHNIKVTAINPGLVETEFSLVRFKGDDERARQVYSNMEALMGEDIAETIYFCISRPRHVNIADLTIFPSAQASSSVVVRAPS